MPECHCGEPKTEEHTCPCVTGQGVATYRAGDGENTALHAVKMHFLCDGTAIPRE